MAEARLVSGLSTLAVCPLGLGDVLFCTPALALLRERLPGSEIGFMCQEGFRDTLRNNPDVDRTHGMPSGRRGLRRRLRGRRLSRELAVFGYQQAVILYEHKDTVSWLANAGIPVERIFVSPTRTDVHRRQKHYGFAAELLGVEGTPGPLRIFPDDEDRRAARALLPEALAAGSRPYVVAHVGNSTAKRGRRRRTGRLRIAHRAWPLENWEALLPLAVRELDVDLVLTGSAKEAEIAEHMRGQLAPSLRERVHNVGGRTPPLRLAALLEPAAAFVGADTGPTHFAAAVGTPTVGLYGPTDLIETIPLPPDPKRLVVLRTGIACSPCDRPVRKKCRDNVCLREIDAARVVGALREVLARR